MSSRRGTPQRESLSPTNLLLRGIPAEYLDCDIDDYVQSEEKRELIERYIENLHTMYEDRICLVMYGANGTGKSYLASIIVKEAYRHRYDSMMITLASYMDLCFKPDKSQEDYDALLRIKKADFLVIDEVGKENFTKTGSNINLLEELMRQALTSGQVLIICTNLPLEDMDKAKGLYSQYGRSIKSLIEGGFVKVEFEEKDYRKTVLKQKNGLKILLGGK